MFKKVVAVSLMLICMVGCDAPTPVCPAARDLTKYEVGPHVVGTLQGITGSAFVADCEQGGWPDTPHCNAIARTSTKLVIGMKEEIEAIK